MLCWTTKQHRIALPMNRTLGRAMWICGYHWPKILQQSPCT